MEWELSIWFSTDSISKLLSLFIDVMVFVCIQQFLENMSQAVKNIEDYLANHLGDKDEDRAKFDLSFSQAAARFKSLDPQQCLSCGEPEVHKTDAYGVTSGVHVRHGPIVEANRERTMGDGSLHKTPGRSPYGTCKWTHNDMQEQWLICLYLIQCTEERPMLIRWLALVYWEEFRSVTLSLWRASNSFTYIIMQTWQSLAGKKPWKNSHWKSK